MKKTLKASELVEQLQKLIEKHGDKVMLFSARYSYHHIDEVRKDAVYVDEEFDIDGTDFIIHEDNYYFSLTGRIMEEGS